jgi:hypothetical protein
MIVTRSPFGRTGRKSQLGSENFIRENYPSVRGESTRRDTEAAENLSGIVQTVFHRGDGISFLDLELSRRN